jgi:hypothetical protein
MRRNSIPFLAVIFLGVLFLTACGGGSGSGNTGDTDDEQTSADLTEEEQAEAATMIMGEPMIGTGIEDALGAGAGMVLDRIKGLEAGKETFEPFECSMGGTITFSATGSGSARTYTAVFDNCCALISSPMSEETTLTFSITGTIRIANSVVTYDDMRVLWACVYGGHELHSCTLNGTSTGTGTAVTYNLEGNCGSTRYTHTGTMGGELSSGHFIVNGTATYTIQGGSGGRIVHCSYLDFDATTATCPDYADAYGLSETYACTPHC